MIELLTSPLFWIAAVSIVAAFFSLNVARHALDNADEAIRLVRDVQIERAEAREALYDANLYLKPLAAVRYSGSNPNILAAIAHAKRTVEEHSAGGPP